jgi:hypothetical protein
VEPLALQALLELAAQPELQVLVELLAWAQVVRPEHQVQEHLEPQAQAAQAQVVRPALAEHPVLLELVVLQVRPEHQEPAVLLAHPGHPELEVLRVHQVQVELGLPVLQVLLALELPVLQVLLALGHLAHQEHAEHPAPQALLELVVRLARPEHPELEVHQVRLVLPVQEHPAHQERPVREQAVPPGLVEHPVLLELVVRLA